MILFFDIDETLIGNDERWELLSIYQMNSISLGRKVKIRSDECQSHILYPDLHTKLFQTLRNYREVAQAHLITTASEYSEYRTLAEFAIHLLYPIYSPATPYRFSNIQTMHEIANTHIIKNFLPSETMLEDLYYHSTAGRSLTKSAIIKVIVHYLNEYKKRIGGCDLISENDIYLIDDRAVQRNAAEKLGFKTINPQSSKYPLQLIQLIEKIQAYELSQNEIDQLMGAVKKPLSASKDPEIYPSDSDEDDFI